MPKESGRLNTHTMTQVGGEIRTKRATFFYSQLLLILYAGFGMGPRAF
ncbi:Uncharacterised protein [Sphingobacterium multivorum]|uniref:Uncharacterized protein n=1 Tax=Sphingobacterium multivorum TaxID=28454 RepID=A0A654DEW0_SPHMU|nr:Uncharacterised protein [Sphingobacterium multivorum]VXD03861.1 conserved hypothetical protein [Sphingobacterium multivorum]